MVIHVWVYTVVLLFIVVSVWYITFPIVTMMLNECEAAAELFYGAGFPAIFTVGKYLAILWCPIVCIGILAWAFISSQRRDVESDVYAA